VDLANGFTVNSEQFSVGNPGQLRILTSGRKTENGKRKTDRDCRVGHATGFTYRPVLDVLQPVISPVLADPAHAANRSGSVSCTGGRAKM
jgi:hypothetical protein